jgi:hypothetical protein
MDCYQRNLGRAVVYFSSSVGKDTTTAATLLVVCGGKNTLATKAGQYASEHSNLFLIPAFKRAYPLFSGVGNLLMYESIRKV